jgi:hypothetical protein
VKTLACVILLGACSFQHGAGSSPRADDGGVTDTSRPLDASYDAPLVPDASSVTCGSECTDEGGTCSGGMCNLSDTGGLACPNASACHINCPANDSCHTGGFTCGQDANCRFDCVGNHSCDNSQTLTCAPGATCDFHCDGPHACDDVTIDCQSGATCMMHCCGGAMSCVQAPCAGAGCQSSASCP